MTNWSPFLSDEMDAWISGPWPDQQQQTQPLPSHPALQSSHPSTPSLAPFLPPLLNSLTSFHSSLGSPRPSFGFHSSLGQPAPAISPTHAPAFGLAGQSPFTAPALSTSSQLARRRRRDGPSLALSQHPSTGPYRPTRPTDNVPTATATTTTTTTDSIATTSASRLNASQQQSHLSPLSHPAANLGPQTLHHPLAPPFHDFPNDDFRQARQREPNSDDVLEALATGDFSSPSLPPYSPQNPPQHQPQHDPIFNHSAHRQRPHSYYPPAHRLPDPETGLFKVEDEGDGDHDLDDKRTVDSLHSEMPATRKRNRAAAASPEEHEVGPSAPKRPRTAVARRAATPGRSRNTPRPAASRNYTPIPAAVAIESDDNDLDSLFDGDGDSGGVELYDLTKSDDGVPKDLFQPVKDSSIKLSTFECVICMDAATNLTVTCCGHMFCAQCLHQAMHTELTKKVCPMCRQRLDKPTPKSKPPAKAFFHLELKLRPSKKNGKQPARR
ncbi:hypothetical protein INS49_007100 [Diaporthe citri]|uniref:uncharacterized protein n=1 Tax=Diaporthe citri TaxID=83186 RepID=UPI001C7EDCC9|nr:uncharacterized protein INS49_007100 [Diaporthe citri]KAG6365489.1 hypothetical protein INS49_007100 [Diaporthe citri]